MSDPLRSFSEAEAIEYLSKWPITIGSRTIAKKWLKSRRINHLPSSKVLQESLPIDAPESYRDSEYHKTQLQRIHWQTLDLISAHIHPNAYGTGKGRSNKDAMVRIKQGIDEGYPFIFRGDFKEFYDRIDQKKLKSQLITALDDRPELVNLLIRLQQLNRYDYWHEVFLPTDQGVIQGLSPATLLANFHLKDFDGYCTELSPNYTRYGDDFALCFENQQDAEKAAVSIRVYVTEQYPTLILHPVKTKIVEAPDLEFLGYAIK